mmetsp:Transcript_58373/g.115893  ORF Transcript_58373/g.115893 Transcript_58373/m.115893 type:complete len:81 (-) Transcript_58373:529-771(-)
MRCGSTSAPLHLSIPPPLRPSVPASLHRSISPSLPFLSSGPSRVHTHYILHECMRITYFWGTRIGSDLPLASDSSSNSTR